MGCTGSGGAAGGGKGLAPKLKETCPSLSEAKHLWEDLAQSIEAVLKSHVVPADLSAYNVLVPKGCRGLSTGRKRLMCERILTGGICFCET